MAFDPDAYLADFDPDAYLADDVSAEGLSEFVDASQDQRRKAALAEQKRQQHKTVLDQMPWYEKLAAGAGLGASNVADKVRRAVLPDQGVGGEDSPVVPGYTPREKDVEAEDALRNHVPEGGGMRWGALGDFLGESAALAPVGLGTGALVRGVAGRVLPQALARIATKAPVIAGAEGAAEGALMADNTAEGAGVGGGLAAALSATLGAGGRVARGLVKPTQEAQELMRRGVDLSLGQMAGPQSMLGKIEGASTSLPLIGGPLERARTKGAHGFAAEAIDTAAGQRVDRGDGSMAEHLVSAFKSLDPRYDAALDGQRIQPGKLVQTMRKLEGYRPEGTPDSYVDVIKRETKDALSTLPHSPTTTPGTTHFGGSQYVDPALQVSRPAQAQNLSYAPDFAARDVQTARKYLRGVRGKAAKETTVEGATRHDVARDVENELTDLLDRELPVEKARALHEVDANRAALARVEKAVAAAGLNDFFTPKQLAHAIRAGDPQDFARGGGYDLRRLAELGEKVVTDPPQTGVRWATLGGLGAATGAAGLLSKSAMAVGAIPYALLGGAAHSPGVKRALVGQTKVQQELGALLDVLRNKYPLAAPTGIATGVVAGMEE